MRLFPSVALVFALSTAGTFVPAAAAPSPPGGLIHESTRLFAGRLLVKPPKGIVEGGPSSIERFVRGLSVRLGHTVSFRRVLVLGWLHLDVDVRTEAETLNVVERAHKIPGVRGAAAEWVWRPFVTPSDPLLEFMWHLDLIESQAAWDITQGSSESLVGVVDTGTAFDHEDLIGKNAGGFDFVSDDDGGFRANDGDGRDADASDPGDGADCGLGPRPSTFHGTHVAGTILATGDNGIGISGIDWNARLVTGRALGRCGGSSVDIDEAVAWMAGLEVSPAPVLAASERPRVINLSLGATGAPCDDFTNDVWNAVTARGHLLVIAAGNEAAPVASPANCPASIAVAAFGPDRRLATYSNFGDEIDIVAPGGDQSRTGTFEDGVLSAIDASVSPFADGTPYTFYEGTSMAAPHVAGVLSLMLDVNAGLSRDAAVDLLKTASGTCVDCQGKPALRADLAVVAAAGTVVTTQPGDPCAGTGFCSAGQSCVSIAGVAACHADCVDESDCDGGESCLPKTGGGSVCVEDGGEGEEPPPGGGCDPERGNMDCPVGEGCVEDDGDAVCVEGADHGVGVGALCEFDRDCATGLCDRGVCTVTCDGAPCIPGYTCDDEAVPGGLCRADSCQADPGICGEGFDCSYSSASRYVCAVGPSNYRGVCGAQPGAVTSLPVLGALLLLLRRRRPSERDIAPRVRR